ncbi:HU family DNA-binding protein [Roseibacillus persicicus]|nr:HU family DNA-binding protein [Roseibacillus persicicus]MDQ8192565.1 integration host factor subunit beta [Roseibacillus persicicus]
MQISENETNSVKPFQHYSTFSTMPTVTKRDLVNRISNLTGLTQQQVFDVIQKTLDEITNDLAKGDTVVMRNFGTFEVKVTKAKVGRNPKDPSKDVPIPPRAVVKFKPGKEMKEQVAPVLPIVQERGE